MSVKNVHLKKGHKMRASIKRINTNLTEKEVQALNFLKICPEYEQKNTSDIIREIINKETAYLESRYGYNKWEIKDFQKDMLLREEKKQLQGQTKISNF